MFASFGVITALQLSTDDGLTLMEVIADLPVDPASIFTITFLLASLAVVLWAGRPKGKRGRAA